MLFFDCSKDNSSLHNFDKTNLSKQLKTATFQPKLPTNLPFKTKESQAEILENQSNIVHVFFTGENGEKMNLQIIKGEVNNTDDLQRADGCYPY